MSIRQKNFGQKSYSTRKIKRYNLVISVKYYQTQKIFNNNICIIHNYIFNYYYVSFSINMEINDS
jgi:hypothetical protein